MSNDVKVTRASKRRNGPRGALGLMIDPVFGSLFWGKLLSTGGLWVHIIVSTIVIYDVTDSALMVGLVSVVQFTPQLLLTPISGKWADRGDAVRQILLGRLLSVVGSGLLGLWIWLKPEAGDGLTAIAVLIASLIVGLAFVVGGPAMQSIIPSLIRPGELSAAMALNTAPAIVARIAGPALGAFVVVQLGVAAAFAFAAGMNLAFAVMIVVIRFPRPEPRDADADYSVRSALRYVRQDRPLLLLLIAGAAAGFGSEPTMTLAPAMAEDLGRGAQLVGDLAMTFGIGAAAGLVVIVVLNGRVRLTMLSSLGLWLMVLGLIAVAVGPAIWFVLFAFAVAGFGFSWAGIGISTLIQERAPDGLRGRVMGFWLVAVVGSRPFAAAFVGTAADMLSVRLGFAITGILLAAMAVLCRPRNLADSPAWLKV